MSQIKTVNKNIDRETIHLGSYVHKSFIMNTEIISYPPKKLIIKRVIRWTEDSKRKQKTEIHEFFVDEE